MNRAMPPRPIIHGRRRRINATPRVLILCADGKLGAWLRSELMRLLAEPWFANYRSIEDFHDSIDGGLIHDLFVYCSGYNEQPLMVKRAIDRIQLFCPEARIVLYAGNSELPRDDRLVAIIRQTNESGLAEVISLLLRPEAA
jgi:hypothetical protein